MDEAGEHSQDWLAGMISVAAGAQVQSAAARCLVLG